ncbi:MAG: hypothetical protein WCI18_13800 [Pseudomonadota bacterium]
MKHLDKFLAIGFLFISYPSKLFAARPSIIQSDDSFTNVYKFNESCVNLSGVWEGLCSHLEPNEPKTPHAAAIEQTGCSEFIIDSVGFKLGVPVKTGSRVDANGYKVETHSRVEWSADNQNLYQTISTTWTSPPESGDTRPIKLDTYENRYSLDGERLFVVRTPLDWPLS